MNLTVGWPSLDVEHLFFQVTGYCVYASRRRKVYSASASLTENSLLQCSLAVAHKALPASWCWNYRENWWITTCFATNLQSFIFRIMTPKGMKTDTGIKEIWPAACHEQMWRFSLSKNILIFYWAVAYFCIHKTWFNSYIAIQALLNLTYKRKNCLTQALFIFSYF